MFTVLCEATPGLGRARNAGWRVAAGGIISFTDDDCYPREDFLSAVLRAFEGNPSMGFVGGKILLHDPTDYRITIQEHDRHEDLLPKTFIPTGMIQGANMSFRRAAIESVNGYDDWFGAGSLFACEDVDIVARISAAGWRGAYDPGPVVYHHHGRKTEADAIRLMKQYDRGRGAYYAKGLLDPVMRLTTLKNWYWCIRSQPYGKTARELAAACEYWARVATAASRRIARLW
jgi:GT2 family glycosyltransferase